MTYVYAGDRDISVTILKSLLDLGHAPEALFVSDGERASHHDQLVDLVKYLPEDRIFRGKNFNESIEVLNKIRPDYIICIHFPYIIKKAILEIPLVGVLNLHPAFLPYNRGWHTPTWAIMDGTPYGATLHFMVEELDAGDIIHQKPIVPSMVDTADMLYKKVKDIEVEVFREALPDILSLSPSRSKQVLSNGSIHSKGQLPQLQAKISKDSEFRGFSKILRALTTNDYKEACYLEENGVRYYLQVVVTSERLK
jgi:methionyl-tRNA formyltransferase